SGVRVDAGGDIAALHPAGLEHVRAVGAVTRVGAGGLAGHLRERRGAGAVARPSPVARSTRGGLAGGAGGEHCGDRAPAEHTERSAAGGGGGDVEGEALVLEVLLGSGEGAAFEAVAGCVLDRDRPGGVLPGAALGAGRFVSATLTGGGEGVADAVVRGVVH